MSDRRAWPGHRGGGAGGAGDQAADGGPGGAGGRRGMGRAEAPGLDPRRDAHRAPGAVAASWARGWCARCPEHALGDVERRAWIGLCAGRHAAGADLALARALFAPSAEVRLTVARTRRAWILRDRWSLRAAVPAHLFKRSPRRSSTARARSASTRRTPHPPGGADARGRGALLAREARSLPARLREQVTSPGGTTAAALAVLEARGHAQMWRDALAAAERRGRELASS